MYNSTLEKLVNSGVKVYDLKVGYYHSDPGILSITFAVIKKGRRYLLNDNGVIYWHGNNLLHSRLLEEKIFGRQMLTR